MEKSFRHLSGPTAHMSAVTASLNASNALATIKQHKGGKVFHGPKRRPSIAHRGPLPQLLKRLKGFVPQDARPDLLGLAALGSDRPGAQIQIAPVQRKRFARIHAKVQHA